MPHMSEERHCGCQNHSVWSGAPWFRSQLYLILVATNRGQAPKEMIEFPFSPLVQSGFSQRECHSEGKKWENWHRAGHMPHAGCWTTDFTCFISSPSHSSSQCWCYYPHFIGEEMEAQRHKALVPRLRANWRSWGSHTASPVCFPLPHCLPCSAPPKWTNFLMQPRSNCSRNNLAVTMLARPWAVGPWKWDRY